MMSEVAVAVVSNELHDFVVRNTELDAVRGVTLSHDPSTHPKPLNPSSGIGFHHISEKESSIRRFAQLALFRRDFKIKVLVKEVFHKLHDLNSLGFNLTAS